MALIDNIVAAYNLDETGGSTMVDAAGSLNGAYRGATINQAGLGADTVRSYRMVDLNSSNCVQLPANSAFAFGTGDFSVAFFINGNFSTNFGTAVIGSDGTFGANSTAIKWDWSGGGFAQRITMSIRNSANNATLNLSSNSNLSADTTYHVVFVRSGNTMTLYINGSSNNSSSGWSAYNANFYRGSSNPTMGWWQADSGDTDLEVYIDALYFWNRAITSGEVTQLYNSGAGLQYPFTTFSPTPMMHHLEMVGGLM